MSKLEGTVEVRRVVRSAEELAELVLAADRAKFEEAVLALWAAHVKRVCLQVEQVWLDSRGRTERAVSAESAAAPR